MTSKYARGDTRIIQTRRYVDLHRSLRTIKIFLPKYQQNSDVPKHRYVATDIDYRYGFKTSACLDFNARWILKYYSKIQQWDILFNIGNTKRLIAHS